MNHNEGKPQNSNISEELNSRFTAAGTKDPTRSALASVRISGAPDSLTHTDTKYPNTSNKHQEYQETTNSVFRGKVSLSLTPVIISVLCERIVPGRLNILISVFIACNLLLTDSWSKAAVTL